MEGRRERGREGGKGSERDRGRKREREVREGEIFSHSKSAGHHVGAGGHRSGLPVVPASASLC